MRTRRGVIRHVRSILVFHPRPPACAVRFRPVVTVLLGGVLALAALFSAPARASAQRIVPNATCPPEGCDYTIFVTPDAGVQEHPQNTGPWTAVFHLVHEGNTGGSYTLTCTALGGVTCLPLSPSFVSLSPGQEVDVTVQYTLGATGGSVRLRAARGATGDNGLYTINAVAVGAACGRAAEPQSR